MQPVARLARTCLATFAVALTIGTVMLTARPDCCATCGTTHNVGQVSLQGAALKSMCADCVVKWAYPTQ